MKRSDTWIFVLLIVGIVVFHPSGGIRAQQAPSNQIIKDRTIASFEVALEQNEFSRNPTLGNLSEVIRWSAQTNRLGACIRWLEYHRVLDRGSLVLQVALADALMLDSKWEQLLGLTQEGSWLFHEATRLGIRALAERKLGIETWKTLWEQACDHVIRESDSFMALVQMVSVWKGWENEIDDLLWRHIDIRGPHTVWCVAVQHQAYMESENLSGLHRLNRWLLEADSSKLDLLNNQVIYAMALGQKEEADSSAEMLFAHRADRPEFSLTLALHSAWKGDRDHAASILNSLPVSWLLESDRALYGWAILGKQEVNSALSEKLAVSAETGNYPSFLRKFLELLHHSKGITQPK